MEEDEEEEEEEVEDEDSDASPFTLQPLNASKPALSRIFYSPPQGSSVPHASLSPTTPSPTKQKKGDESMPPLSLSDEAYAERLSRMIVPQRKASQNAQKYLAGNARIEEDSSSNKIGLPRLASSPFLLALPTPLQLTAQTFSDAKSHPDPYLRRNHPSCHAHALSLFHSDLGFLQAIMGTLYFQFTSSHAGLQRGCCHLVQDRHAINKNRPHNTEPVYSLPLLFRWLAHAGNLSNVKMSLSARPFLSYVSFTITTAGFCPCAVFSIRKPCVAVPFGGSFRDDGACTSSFMYCLSS